MCRHTFFSYKWYLKAAASFCAAALFFSQSFTISAGKEELIASHQAMPIQSNEVENWPTGPVVSAESAILIEADTGTILYAKNIHKQQYPASTTKILTTLIAYETCSLDELVTFSKDAVFDIDRGSNHIAIDVGEKLTMEDCLNAILIRSANEVSLAVAEHISGGSWEDFAVIMNERARELGCLNSNFVNPNGLPNEEHVTTAYDLAMIGKAFFANEALCKITMTPLLKISATEYQPDNIIETNKMELIPNRKYSYEYLVGCKTGYTNAARNTLVSCAEKDGMKLICVILNDESPYQYEDTISLFDYGFHNFEKVNVSKTETKYDIDNTGFFYSNNDIFGNSQPILSLNEEACIILPKTVTFQELTSSISYDTPSKNQAALITYSYHDVILGSVPVDLAVSSKESYTFDTVPQLNEEHKETAADNTSPSFVFVNIIKVFIAIGIMAVIIAILFFARIFLKNYYFSRRKRRSHLRSRRQGSSYRTKNSVSMGSSFQMHRKEQIREAKRRQRTKRFKKFRDYD